MTWNETFESLFNRCLQLYVGGNRNFESYYSEEDLAFLGSIGYKPREFFDFVEDYGDGADPLPSTAMLIAAVRRDYFIVVQEGVFSDEVLTSSSAPGRGESLGGMSYLPRIIAKAEAKLRGELDSNLMYCCGGDRGFLRQHGDLHPADFLRRVWAADGDHQQIVDWIKGQ